MTFDTMFTGKLSSSLRRNGIDTIEKLLSKTETELSIMDQIGRTSVLRIKSILADSGLHLRFDHEHAEISFSDNKKLAYVTCSGKTLVYSLMEKEEFADSIWDKLDNMSETLPND